MCYLFFFPSFFSTQLSFFSFLPWTGLPRKTEKKGVKKNLQRGSIRSNSVYEVFFKAFEEKHLSGGGMRPNCSQSLLILPVQSPCRARAGGRRGVPRLGRGIQTPSFDPLSVLMSFESWLVFIKPFRSAVQGHYLTSYNPPSTAPHPQYLY